MSGKDKLLAGLVGAVLLLAILVVALLIRGPGGGKAQALKPDEVEAEKKETPRPVAQTYHVEATAELQGRLIKKNWGVEEYHEYAYIAGSIFDSTVVSKDAKTIVEERQYQACAWKLVVYPKGFGYSSGWIAAAALVLGPQSAGALKAWEMVCSKAIQLADFKYKEYSEDKEKTRLGLAGNRYRITYDLARSPVKMTVDRWDGKAWAPLSESAAKERDTVLVQHLMLDANAFKEADRYDLSARALALTFDPQLDAMPSGMLTAQKQGTEAYGGTTCAKVRLSGQVHYVGTGRKIAEHKGEDVAEFMVRDGHLLYDTGNRIVRRVRLEGTARYMLRSTDHVLFEARFESEPKVVMQYTAERR